MGARSRYAEGTDVPVARSRDEIIRTLERFSASGFAFGRQGPLAMVMFEAHGRRIRFIVPDPKTTVKPGPWRTATKRLEAEEMRLWRSLAMAIKSKLDMVESGITSFEDEFLPYTLLPTGQTFAEAARDEHFIQTQLAAANQPAIIALPGGKRDAG